MAKYIIAVDTDAKTISMTKDGMVVNPEDMTCGSYTSMDDAGNTYQRAYVSHTTAEPDGGYTTRSASFKCGDKAAAEEIESRYNMPREIGKLETQARAAAKLEKILSKKKMPMDKKKMMMKDEDMQMEGKKDKKQC